MEDRVVEGSLIESAHALIAEIVQPDDTVVDATVGNGHDTLFLAQCVGDGGKVIGFDVQEDALKAAHKRLSDAGIHSSVCELHHQGHERMGEYGLSGVSAVMFNLGYLPGSDKRTITQVDTTLDALKVALGILEAGGILSVMCYPGHAGGDTEAGAVTQWMSDVSKEESQYSVTRYQREGAKNTTPFLIVVRK